jgi:hypothetical protein
MIPLLAAAGAFVCVMMGALLGLWLGQRVPEHCRDENSREAIQLAAGMISFLAALVLGLLTASVQGNFDTTNSQITGFAAQLAMLDQTLSDMGPEAAGARGILRHYTALSLQDNWPEETGAVGPTDPSVGLAVASMVESLSGITHPVWFEGTHTNQLLNQLRLAVMSLQAQGQPNQSLRDSAVSQLETLVQTRWALHERTQNPLLPSVMLVLIFWTTAIFMSFGYTAPANVAVVLAFLIAAASLAISFGLLVEMDLPFEGLIRISSHPMHDALHHMMEPSS